MGSGRWNTDTYEARASAKKAAGISTFDYSDRSKRSAPSSWKVHEDLDPLSVNKNGANTGKNIREALDNEDHPESLGVAVIFDVTGSMGRIPEVLQQKLPDLHGMLLRRGIADVQLLFGAVGDANTDRVPLQIGQFESDNRMDEQLEQILLEGGGGGQMRESYELAMYYLARHTALDCVEKRQKKGYLFLMGDEMPYDAVDPVQVKKYCGDDLPERLSTADLVAELEEKFEVFFLFVREGSYRSEQILPAWQKLLGERALVLDDANAVSETIALTLGLLEGQGDLEAEVEELAKKDAQAAEAAGKALAGVS